MVVRRKVNPFVANMVWNLVHRITDQRQLANAVRLSRALHKELPDWTIEAAERAISDCIDDGVLIHAPKGCGPQSYVTPTPDTLPKTDNHDWYCIECHLPGDVEFCASCHNVFHKSCQSIANESDTLFPRSTISKTSELNSLKVKGLDQSSSRSCVDDTTTSDKEESKAAEKTDTPESESVDKSSIKEIGDDDICSVCKLIAEDVFQIDVEELNYLSGFIFARIKDWLPVNICDEPWNSIETDKKLKSRYFWYKSVDLQTMEMKARTRQYNCLNEIHADLLSIRHNVAVFHGLKSTEVEAADYMLVDARHDIEEIKQCINCYHNSNEKMHKYWFCLPCNVPHELVWAKQKGFDYWPAKVIKRTGKQYDVRFFGAKYLRAFIDEKSIKPIHIPMETLKIKKSITFNKAYEELQLHQLWLRTPKEELDNIIEMKLSNRKVLKPPVKKTPVKRRQSSPIRKEIIPTKKTKATSIPSLPELNSQRETRGRRSYGPPGDLSQNESLRTAYEDSNCLLNSTAESQDDVISSTQDMKLHQLPREAPSGSPENNPPKLSDNKNIEAAEDLRIQMLACADREQLIQLACDALQEQVDKFTEKIRNMSTSQTSIISDIKKKQWCFNCEEEAIYHCCWNTSYCSTQCQQTHWHVDHKRNCRRKRN